MVNQIAQEQWANPNPTTVPGLIRMPGPNVQPYQPSPQTTRSLANKGTALAHARMDPTVIAALKESAAHGRGIRSGQLAFDPNTGERISGGARSYADELPMGEFSQGGTVTADYDPDRDKPDQPPPVDAPLSGQALAIAKQQTGLNDFGSPAAQMALANIRFGHSPADYQPHLNASDAIAPAVQVFNKMGLPDITAIASGVSTLSAKQAALNGGLYDPSDNRLYLGPTQQEHGKPIAGAAPHEALHAFEGNLSPQQAYELRQLMAANPPPDGDRTAHHPTDAILGRPVLPPESEARRVNPDGSPIAHNSSASAMGLTDYFDYLQNHGQGWQTGGQYVKQPEFHLGDDLEYQGGKPVLGQAPPGIPLAIQEFIRNNYGDVLHRARGFADGGEVTAGDGSDADKEKQAAEYAAGVKAAQAASQTAQEQAMVGMLPPSAPKTGDDYVDAPTGSLRATLESQRQGESKYSNAAAAAATALPLVAFGPVAGAGSLVASDLAKTAGAPQPVQQIAGMAPFVAGGPASLLAKAGEAIGGGGAQYLGGKADEKLGLPSAPGLGGPLALLGGIAGAKAGGVASEVAASAAPALAKFSMPEPNTLGANYGAGLPMGDNSFEAQIKASMERIAEQKAAGEKPTGLPAKGATAPVPTVYPNGEYSAAARAESPGSIRANVYGDVAKPPEVPSAPDIQQPHQTVTLNTPDFDTLLKHNRDLEEKFPDHYISIKDYENGTATFRITPKSGPPTIGGTPDVAPTAKPSAIDPGSAENPLRGLINIADGSSPNARPAPLTPAPVEAGGATAPSPVAEPVTSSAGSSPPVSPGAADLQELSKATGLGIGHMREVGPEQALKDAISTAERNTQLKTADYGETAKLNALQKAQEQFFPATPAGPADMARPLGLATDIQAVPAPTPAELDARIASGRPASRGATVAPAGEAVLPGQGATEAAAPTGPTPAAATPSPAPSGLANITLADLVDALSKRAEGATAGPVPKEGELTPTEVSRAAKSEIGNLQTSWEKYNGLSDSELISQADAAGVRPAGTAPLTSEGKMDPAYRDQLTGALAMKEASPPPTAERSVAEQIAARQPTVEQQMTEMLDKLFGPDAPMGRMNPELDRHLAIEESGKVADNMRNWEKQPVGATGGGAPPPNVGDRVMAGSGGGPSGQDRTLAQVFRDTGASTLDNLRAATNVPMSFLLNAHTTSFKAGVGQQLLHPMNALAAMKGLVEGALHPDVAASYFEGARNNPMLNAAIDPRVAPISADIFNKGGNKGIGLFQSQHGNAVMAELRDPDLAFQGKSWIDRNIIEKIPGRERTSAAITNQMNIIRAANYATEANRLWNALGKPDMSLPENAKLIGQFKDIAEVINHGAGRGDINPFSYKGVNVGMGGRSWVARVQMPLDVVFRNEAGIGPKTFNPLGSGARPLAMRQLLATAGFAAGMTTLSKALADQAGLNVVPQSLNPVANLPFGAGKFIVNNAAGTGRVSNDFTQGFGPMLRFVGNVAEAVHSGDGEALQNTVLEYLRNEATNPAASKAIDVATGKDWKGDPLPGQPGFNPKGISDRAREQFMQVVKHPGEAAFSTLTPLGVQEIVKAIQEVGPAGAVLALPGLGASSVSATPISLGSQIYDAQQQVADSGNKLLANPDWLQSQIAANGVDKNKGMPPETTQALQRGLADGSLNYFNVGPHVQQLIRDELAQSDPQGLQRLDALVKQRGDPFEVQREYKDKIQSTVGAQTDQKAMSALKNGPSDLGLYKGQTRQSFSSVVSSEYKDVQAQIAKGKDTPEYQDALAKSQEKAKASAANPDRAPNVISQMLNDYYSLGDKFTKTDGTFDYPGYQGAVNKMLLDAHAKNPDMAELLAFNIQKDKTQDWQVRQELAKVQPVVDAYYGNRDKNPGTQNAWRASNPKEDAILWYAGYVPDVRSSAAYNYGMRLVEGGSRRPTLATTGIRGQ